MKTEHRFAATLKAMMQEKPLDEISVLSLCRRCKVNRQTFYYHFHDMYDLLTLVYLDEKINDIDKVKTFKEMISCIFLYYKRNEKFIDATISSVGKDLVLDLFYSACYQAIMNFLGAYEISKVVGSQNKKNIARFYASAYSHSILYYLANYKNKSLEGLFNTFAFLDQLDLRVNMQNQLKYERNNK